MHIIYSLPAFCAISSDNALCHYLLLFTVLCSSCTCSATLWCHSFVHFSVLVIEKCQMSQQTFEYVHSCSLILLQCIWSTPSGMWPETQTEDTEAETLESISFFEEFSTWHSSDCLEKTSQFSVFRSFGDAASGTESLVCAVRQQNAAQLPNWFCR